MTRAAGKKQTAPLLRGGIIFTCTSTQLRDEFGNLVMCTACGGIRWDVTLGPAGQQRIECTAADCGKPAC